MRNGPKCNREGALLIRSGAMRITRVSTTIVNAEMRNWVFVRVDTDSDGLYGWGERTCGRKTRAVAGAIGDLEPLLIGRDPRDIEQIMVDFHGRPASIGATLAYIQALEPGRPMFVEEVLPPGDAPAMAR